MFFNQLFTIMVCVILYNTPIQARSVRFKRQSLLKTFVPEFPELAPVGGGSAAGVNVEPLTAVGDAIGIGGLGDFQGGDSVMVDIDDIRVQGGTNNCFAGVCTQDVLNAGDIDGMGTLGAGTRKGLDLSGFSRLLGFDTSVLATDQTGYNPFTGKGGVSKGLQLPFGIGIQQSSGFSAPGLNEIARLLGAPPVNAAAEPPVTPPTTPSTTTKFSFNAFIDRFNNDKPVTPKPAPVIRNIPAAATSNPNSVTSTKGDEWDYNYDNIYYENPLSGIEAEAAPQQAPPVPQSPITTAASVPVTQQDNQDCKFVKGHSGAMCAHLAFRGKRGRR